MKWLVVKNGSECRYINPAAIASILVHPHARNSQGQIIRWRNLIVCTGGVSAEFNLPRPLDIARLSADIASASLQDHLITPQPEAPDAGQDGAP